jgi:glycosyltransferase involved in cell wall biosynthesis
MKVVYLTAGAAGMFCGSCMHDNSLARTLRQIDVDCVLQPVYTPIRTDEESVAGSRVFLGGIHVYLLQRMPWLRFVPRRLLSVLDFPPLIRWATRRAGATDPAVLGDLSVSMLRGLDGNQAGEFRELVDWIVEEINPDAIVLTNLLIGGGLAELRKRLPGVTLIVMLQGDDIFLDHLPESSRQEVIKLCRDLVPCVDHFCVNSRFYGEKMGGVLNIPAEKIVLTPLSIDLLPFQQPVQRSARPDQEFRIGFFARIAPEKGLHHLVDAFQRIAEQDDHVTLHAAGWLGSMNEPYLKAIEKQLESAGLSERFVYHGSPDLAGKIQFMHDIDVLSVPTEYQDPKGLFVLESLAAGTPVVMPEHGAFGELLESTGGGLLVPPGDVEALRDALVALKDDPLKRRQLAQAGKAAVQSKHSIDSAARQLAELIRSVQAAR